MEQRNAFTLIELLIVVAIIGILAAIAIPNFQNAQIRAKVAKAESDLQAQATALESYRLDHNYYPPVNNCGYVKDPVRWSGGMALIPLTTPLAYMATLPKDPFNEDGMATSAGKGQMDAYGVFWYMDRRTRTGGSCDTTSVEMHFISNAHLWAMKSAGPDRDESIDPNFSSGQRGFVHVIYLMSNGLRSNGDIYRYGP